VHLPLDRIFALDYIAPGKESGDRYERSPLEVLFPQGRGFGTFGLPNSEAIHTTPSPCVKYQNSCPFGHKEKVMRIQTFRRVSAFVGLVLALALHCPNAKSQGIGYRPGTTITLNVTFDGRDADQISIVYVWLNLTTPVKDGQDGFQKQLSGQAQKVGNTFQATFAVGDNQAAGTYQINQIRTVINQSAPIDFYYQISEIPNKTFQIDNSKITEKPKIKSITVQ
jgi:hypothetical protein